jgi:uncharacterized protein YjeT (DUF2065 family)
MDYFLSVIGMVFIIEAIPYILFPKKVKDFAQFIHTVPNSKLQATGIIAAFVGLLIIYLGRHVIGM